MADHEQGPAVPEATFTTFPARGMRDSRLTRTDIQALHVIGFYDRRSIPRQKGGGCFANQRLLAEQIGIDRSNLRRSIKKLVHLGYVERCERGDGRRGYVLRIIETLPDESIDIGVPHAPYDEEMEGVAETPTKGFPTPPERGSPHPPKRVIEKTNRRENSSLRPGNGNSAATDIEPDEITQIRDQWDKVAVPAGAPAVRKFSDKRRKLCEAALASDGLEDILQAIERLAKSSFLLGASGKSDWKADIAWLLKPESVNAILEGKYDDRTSSSGKSSGNSRGDGDDAYGRLLKKMAGISDYRIGDTRDGFTRAIDRRLNTGDDHTNSVGNEFYEFDGHQDQGDMVVDPPSSRLAAKGGGQ